MMITSIYQTLNAQRATSHVAIIAVAADAFAVITTTMKAAQDNGPRELYACYALAHEQAREGLAVLNSHFPRLAAESRGAVKAKEPDRLANLTEVSELAALTCRRLIEAAPRCRDAHEQLALINASAHAGQIRDLLAP
jgi:hypothetical protein